MRGEGIRRGGGSLSLLLTNEMGKEDGLNFQFHWGGLLLCAGLGFEDRYHYYYVCSR